MIFPTMMGMVLRVVGMVMALVLSLTMMAMVLMIAMASRSTTDRLARLVGHLPTTRAMFKV